MLEVVFLRGVPPLVPGGEEGRLFPSIQASVTYVAGCIDQDRESDQPRELGPGRVRPVEHDESGGQALDPLRLHPVGTIRATPHRDHAHFQDSGRVLSNPYMWRMI